MATTIWRTNSARNAVRYFTQLSRQSHLTHRTASSPSLPSRFSSLRHFRSSRDPISRLFHIVDPKLASYGVENPIYAVIQLAQTTMRSELGKITLDKTFEERDTLNKKIVVSN
ncbi:hypothetical protein Ahy_A10g048879 isoform D [Arachis hypogaea]|uniref:Uncharacterized protein n=1 Tax=Arachis hypogaea TaxID=3818 RepID=A0A445B645_ARAHY|nr:hypothetical protein Ahy_A10g048879 isoform D [Arachis hypogaea]